MNPDRAASILRELLQTPDAELGHLPRRMGLQGQPAIQDLQRAQELLRALVVALDSGPGPNWDRVQTAWEAMVTRHGRVQASVAASPPAWIRDMPPKPTLGDPAPGTSGHAAAQEQRQRFVPRAQPAPPPAASGAAAPPPAPAFPAAAGGSAPQAGDYPPRATQPGYPPAPSYPAPAATASAAPAPGYPAPAATAQPATPTRASGGPPPPPRRSAPPAGPPRAAEENTHVSAGDIRNSVARYAAFCAACAAQPERVSAIEIEYGLGVPGDRGEVDEDWQDRFDDDPELHAKWEALYRQFRDQLGGR